MSNTGRVFAIGVVVGAAIALLLRPLARAIGRRHTGTPDALTGVAGRADGQVALNRLHTGDAVAIVDLDGLKARNDRDGHAAGDQALVALAQHLSAGVRKGDTVARWGGDEFVVILRGGGTAASAVVDRLRRTSPTPFSAGVATHLGGDPTETLAAADGALLEAKRAGGDRVATS